MTRGFAARARDSECRARSVFGVLPRGFSNKRETARSLDKPWRLKKDERALLYMSLFRFSFR